MHFEILVEDQSGKIALEHLVPKIIGTLGNPHTWRIIGYKGMGRLPKDLKPGSDPAKRALLCQLPRILQGYGRSLPQNAAVVVVVDLDNRDCQEFKNELLAVLKYCTIKPRVKFRIAIEELEAWYLGDMDALFEAFPSASKSKFLNYKQDSICGTWETLADIIHKGGAAQLKKSGWPTPGKTKCDWAEKISPLMDINHNESRSFQVFRDCLLQLIKE